VVGWGDGFDGSHGHTRASSPFSGRVWDIGLAGLVSKG